MAQSLRYTDDFDTVTRSVGRPWKNPSWQKKKPPDKWNFGTK